MRGEGSKSQLQADVGSYIFKLLPNEVILEEFYIPIERLYLDFFIPRKMLAVEINGEQHEKFVPFFHGTMSNFKESVERDAKKKRWCELNNIRLISLKHNCTYDEVKEIITSL